VRAEPFASAEASLDYLDWRFRQYPLFRELMELYEDHAGEVVLDYGCGPGNDIVGFLVRGNVGKIIGVDISAKALALAEKRLELHGVDSSKLELIKITDAVQRLPLRDGSVDYVYCEGVLHHASDPEAILREFLRVLKPGGRGCVMVYNWESIWLHLHAAYIKKVLEGAYSGLTIEDAFARTTDSDTCPIARPYRSGQFGGLLESVGFEWEFLGGYFSRYELDILRTHKDAAEQDPRLPREHREFLLALSDDGQGYPVYRGKPAGVGGVSRLRKRPWGAGRACRRNGIGRAADDHRPMTDACLLEPDPGVAARRRAEPRRG